MIALTERREMLLTLFDPDDVRLPARKRSVAEIDQGRRARRDQRALRTGLRFCGVCQGRGDSLKRLRRALGTPHGRDRVPDFYVYVWLPNDVSPSTDNAGVRAVESSRGGCYYAIPWFATRLGCWACGGSGFNCSGEMARALELRCHTQQPSSPSPMEGARL